MRRLLIAGAAVLLIGGGYVSGQLTNHPVAIKTLPEISPSPVSSPLSTPTVKPSVKPTVNPTSNPTTNPITIPITLPKPTAKPTVKPIIKPSPKPTPRKANTVRWNDPTMAISPAVGGEIDGPTVIGAGFPVIVTGTWTCTKPPIYGFLIGVRDLNTGAQTFLRAQEIAMLEMYFNESSIVGHNYLLVVQFFGDDTVMCDWNLTLSM